MRLSKLHNSVWQFAADLLGRDQARPVEWISLLGLLGWLQFLVSSPEAFTGARYAAFATMPPLAWAQVVSVIILGQLLAMFPGRYSHIVRCVAMLMAAAMWSVISWNSWVAEVAPPAARTNTVIALAAAFTAIYLGLVGRR